MASLRFLTPLNRFMHGSRMFSSVFSLEDSSRRLIAKIIEQDLNIPFVPYKIGPGGCSLRQSFSAGHIDLQLLVTDKHGKFIDTSKIDITNSNYDGHRTLIFEFKTVFKDGLNTLQKFVQTGDVDEEFFKPLIALREFFIEKELHERSILNAINRPVPLDESEVCTVLAVHLLSRLVFPGERPYVVSNDYNDKPKVCPCRICDNEIIYGSTGFGSTELWFGESDVMVFPKGKGLVTMDVSLNNERTIYDIDDDVDALEVEQNKTLLQEEENFKTIARQAITFSFYQRKYQKSLGYDRLTTLIPYIAICEDRFDIYMYDTEYDVFLKNNTPPLPLWLPVNNPSYLNPTAIVYLWMIINHLSFQLKLTQNQLEKTAQTFGLKKYITDEEFHTIEKTVKLSKVFRPNKTLNESVGFPGIIIE